MSKKQKLSFYEWMNGVDEYILDKTGLDTPNLAYRDMYNTGLTMLQAADTAIAWDRMK